eukprot:SAG11_NODE_7820_length_1092_cov_1.689829_2_plen_147_part_00
MHSKNWVARARFQRLTLTTYNFIVIATYEEAALPYCRSFEVSTHVTCIANRERTKPCARTEPRARGRPPVLPANQIRFANASVENQGVTAVNTDPLRLHVVSVYRGHCDVVSNGTRLGAYIVRLMRNPRRIQNREQFPRMRRDFDW